MSSPRRGEIWLADLNPQQGTTPGKTWPVLVVQATALSAAGHPSTLVLSLTTNLVDDAAPLRVRVAAHGRTLESDVMIDQLRAIDNASSPTNAKITIDNVAKGNTPVIAELTRKDTHIIKFELAGFMPYEATITRKVSGWVWGNSGS
ncbi:PEGA domain-containing protein [bacterium]|nr:PEGA domain-containing protein [bacterium]